MKKLVFSLLIASAINGFAQKSIIPSITELPPTGLEYLQQTNPYMLTQISDPANAVNWLNQDKSSFVRSQVPGYFKQKRIENWSDNKWKDFLLENDSFILNNQNNIDMVYEEVAYTYPGFSVKNKYTYAFTYDANGRPVAVINKSAKPVTSNNYEDYLKYFIAYDVNGKRIADTMYFEQNIYPTIGTYSYDVNGDLIALIWINTDPNAPKDTITKTYFTYYNNNLMYRYNLYFDSDLGEFAPSSADTFAYDSNNNIIEHIHYELTVVNGTSVEFKPVSNEIYTYTLANKLSEIQTMEWLNDNWKYTYKTMILYDAGDEAALGYLYPFINNEWSIIPDKRILFNEFNGLEESLHADASIQIYPNPVCDILQIELTDKTKRISSIQLMDITGKLVLTMDENFKNQTKIPVSALNKGIYFAHIQLEEDHVIRKIVIE